MHDALQSSEQCKSPQTHGRERETKAVPSDGSMPAGEEAELEELQSPSAWTNRSEEPRAVSLLSRYSHHCVISDKLIPQCLRVLLYKFNTWDYCEGSPDSSVGEESACNAEDPGSIPGLGRSAREGVVYPIQYSWASLVTQLVKNPPVGQETWIRYLGWEDPLEKGKATHSSILAWRIPWTV